MNSRWLAAILTLPVPVALLVPAGLLLAFRGDRFALALPGAALWAALLVGLAGCALAVWSALTFKRHAGGTPAPWDPPTRFVARGPYRYIRNPMILGVILLLLAEGLVFRSWPLLVWFLLFTAGNLVYIPLIEERGLARRFGEMYLQYKREVPRWIPRTTREGGQR